MELSKLRILCISLCIASAYLFWGMMISLQPPFYPAEAERKGATPSQYGFVFGIANLAAFVTAPLVSKYGAKIGPKLLCNFGAFLQASCTFAFGFLTFIENKNVFLGLSYLLRALGGMADVIAWNAVISILMKLFPEKVATIMSWTEMLFGLGYTLGPALGSFLYQMGGFTLPFLVVGSIGFVIALALLFGIPKVQTEPTTSTAGDNSLTLTKVFKSWPILLPFIDLFISLFGYGMIMSMLETHLKQSGASQSQTATTFLIFGICYMLSTPVSGYICDKIAFPSIISIVGNLTITLAFVFLGPIFKTLKSTWRSITIATAFAALGYGPISVSTFGRAQRAAKKLGYEQDIATYLMISGLWSAAWYSSCFLGPTLAGILVDNLGFRQTTVILVCCFACILVIDFIELIQDFKNSRQRQAYDRFE